MSTREQIENQARNLLRGTIDDQEQRWGPAGTLGLSDPEMERGTKGDLGTAGAWVRRHGSEWNSRTSGTDVHGPQTQWAYRLLAEMESPYSQWQGELRLSILLMWERLGGQMLGLYRDLQRVENPASAGWWFGPPWFHRHPWERPTWWTDTMERRALDAPPSDGLPVPERRDWESSPTPQQWMDHVELTGDEREIAGTRAMLGSLVDEPDEPDPEEPDPDEPDPVDPDPTDPEEPPSDLAQRVSGLETAVDLLQETDNSQHERLRRIDEVLFGVRDGDPEMHTDGLALHVKALERWSEAVHTDHYGEEGKARVVSLQQALTLDDGTLFDPKLLPGQIQALREHQARTIERIMLERVEPLEQRIEKLEGER